MSDSGLILISAVLFAVGVMAAIFWYRWRGDSGVWQVHRSRS